MSIRSNILLPILSAAFILSTTSQIQARLIMPDVGQEARQHINSYERTHPSTPYPFPPSSDFDGFCLPLLLIKTSGNDSPHNVADRAGQLTIAYIQVLAEIVAKNPTVNVDDIGTAFFSCIAAAGEALVRLVITEDLDRDVITSFDNDNLRTWDHVMKSIPSEKASTLINKWAFIQGNWGK